MNTNIEKVEKLVSIATIERISSERGITVDEAKLLIQAYFDAKALTEMCGSGKRLQLENFLPPMPVPEGEPAKVVVYDEVERAVETATAAKQKRDNMRAMHDAVRKINDQPPLTWTHTSKE